MPRDVWRSIGVAGLSLVASSNELENGGFVIGAAALFKRGNALATMATITLGMAMIGIAGIYQAQSHGQSFPIALSISPLKDDQYQENTAVSGSLPNDGNDCQSDDNRCQIPEIVADTPAERATAYASQLVEWCAGETYDWSDVQIDYRRFAKQQKWRLEIADRILSKALKDAGCIRAQEDRRREGKGRPITITVPWRAS